jgi:hypothetical protein
VDDTTLPPLPPAEWLGYDPERGDLHGHSFDALREFARAAVLLDRQQRAAPSAEPVGHLHSNGDFCWKRGIAPEIWPVSLYEAPPAPSAEPVPDDEYMIDMFSAAELRAYDYGCKESMDAFTRLLDGKGSRDGVCQPQWQALRARVWKLMDAAPPDHREAMQQALEALEERYIGALRDNAIDALRAALGEK